MSFIDTFLEVNVDLFLIRERDHEIVYIIYSLLDIYFFSQYEN